MSGGRFYFPSFHNDYLHFGPNRFVIYNNKQMIHSFFYYDLKMNFYLGRSNLGIGERDIKVK